MENLFEDLFGFLDFSEGFPPEALFVLIVFSIIIEVFGLACNVLGKTKSV